MSEDVNFDFGMFNFDDLFEGTGGRKPDETVDRRFRRPYSLNPLEKLIRLEEGLQLQRNAGLMHELIRRNLSRKQYFFLRSVLGADWEKRRRSIPLEYRHFNERELEAYFFEHLDEVREKLDILVERCGRVQRQARMSAVQRVLSIPFNLATRSKIIQIYESVRTGNASNYPAGFFHPNNERVPRILVKHLVDEVLKLPHDRYIRERLTRQEFADNHLNWMLQQYFSGSVNRALRFAYTRDEFPSLYATPEHKSEDVLREVLMKLDFGKRKDEKA